MRRAEDTDQPLSNISESIAIHLLGSRCGLGSRFSVLEQSQLQGGMCKGEAHTSFAESDELFLGASLTLETSRHKC